ncbi:MAG: class I SAM-dependent methyltransferase [Bacteroidetes bacterium]|nr:class I SAM-dependent methyltransferase [Bacteroidota bacterium]
MPIDLAYSCHYCHSTQGTIFLATEHMLGLGGEFRYASCSSCGSLQLLNIPKDLGFYYPSDYYSFGLLQPSGFLRRLLKKIRMQAFLATGYPLFSPPFGSYWLNKLHSKFKERIADVGCGNGQLLYELHVSGFKNLHGFDPFLEKGSQLVAGLKLWKKELAQTDLCFDVLMLHHSFEHMVDPEQVLKTCFERLNPGGRLLVRCPVADAAVWKEKQCLWVQLDAPRHLTVPSIQGFVGAAQRCGFEVQEIIFDSTAFQFWGTALYEQGEKLDRGRISTYFSEKQLKEWEQKAIQYNRDGIGDQACFFCVKPRENVDL